MGDPSLEACSLEADQAGCFIGPGLWLLATSIALVKKTGSSLDTPNPAGAPMVNLAKGFLRRECCRSAVSLGKLFASAKQSIPGASFQFFMANLFRRYLHSFLLTIYDMLSHPC